MAIAEREYATAPVIRFTTFTSCIGVIGAVTDDDGNLAARGVHLTVQNQSGIQFSPIIAAQVVSFFDPASLIYIVGEISVWDNLDSNSAAGKAYHSVVEGLEVPDGCIIDEGTGVYGANVNGGIIRWTKDQPTDDSTMAAGTG